MTFENSSKSNAIVERVIQAVQGMIRKPYTVRLLTSGRVWKRAG